MRFTSELIKESIKVLLAIYSIRSLSSGLIYDAFEQFE